MKKYRICKNKYGYYKIQRRVPPTKLFWFIYLKEKWVDSSFLLFNRTCAKYSSKEEALEQIKKFVKSNMKNNEEWDEGEEI